MSFFTIFKRDLKNLALSPVLLIYNTIYPFLTVLILSYLTSSNYGSSVTSYDYYGISIMIFFILFAGTTAANSFMENRIKNSNLRIMYAPINISDIYISKILASFIFTSICCFIEMLILNVLLNVNYGGKNVIYVIIILEMFNLFSCAVGILFCCIFKSENLANKVLSVFLNIFGILGGAFFPIDSLGKAVEKLSYISPTKWVNLGIFKIIYDNNFSYFMPTVMILVIFTLLCILGCKLTFKVEDYV